MGIILWIVAALFFAGLFVFLSSLNTRKMLPEVELPSGEKESKTPVQRLANATFWAMAFLTVVAAAIVAYYGPRTWWEDNTVRLTVTFLLLVGLLAYLIFALGARHWEKRQDGMIDERDSAILGRASAGAAGAMMVVFAIWIIALTESYRDAASVPTYYLYLIFWSSVMANVLATVASIVLAYRRR